MSTRAWRWNVTFITAVLLTGAGLSSPSWAGPFAAGNVVVCRVGDGAAPLSANGNAVFLDEYTPGGTLVQSVALPTTANGAQQQLISSGDPSEGILSRSTDGRYVMLIGYGADLGGAAGLATTAATTVPRVVGRVKYDGTIDTSTALSDMSNANNPRSAFSTDGTNIWVGGASGSSGGVHFTTVGSTTSTQLFATVPKGVRQAAIFGGQLYFDSNATGFLNISALGSGAPTTGGQVAAELPGLTDMAGNDAYFFVDLGDGHGLATLYVANDSLGEVLKYTLVSGTWTAEGSITAVGAHGVVATVNTGTHAVTLYITQTTGTDGTLSTFTDTTGFGGAASGTATTLATAAANEVFLGVALSPVNAGGPTATPTATTTPGPGATATATATATTTATRTATPTATATLVVVPATPTPTGPGVPPFQVHAALVCEKALGKASSALVSADLSAIQHCSVTAFTCIQSTSGSARDACLASARADCTARRAGVTQLRDQLAGSITATCADVRVPLEILRSQDGFGFEKIEPSCQANANLSLDSIDDVVACVQQATMCRAERALAVAIPRISDLLAQSLDVASSGICVPPPTGGVDGLTDPIQAGRATTCQANTSVAAQGILARRFALTQHCADALFKCRITDAPVERCAGIAAKCNGQIGALTTGATSNLAALAKVYEKACKNVTPESLMNPDGVGFAGASAHCNALGVRPIGDPAACLPQPGGDIGVTKARAACPSHTIGTCVARAFDCAASTIVRSALPFAENELGRFDVALTENPFCAELSDWTHDSLAPADLVDVALKDMIPTQAVIGYDEIFYKLGRYRANRDSPNKRFDDYCADNGQIGVVSANPGATLHDPTTFKCSLPVGGETAESIFGMKAAVYGPGGHVYLTDGHHNFTAFWETPDGGSDLHIRVPIQGDFRHLGMSAFWKEMQLENKVWLRDGNNKQITPDQLPQHLGLANMANDPYRALVYFTRDIGYTVPNFPTPPPPFQEFQWGVGLRPLFDLSQFDLTNFTTYLDLVKQVSQAMAAIPDTQRVDLGSPLLIGPETAANLSKIPSWNAGARDNGGEFAKLSQPFAASKPGKLAYAVQYGDSPGP